MSAKRVWLEILVFRALNLGMPGLFVDEGEVNRVETFNTLNAWTTEVTRWSTWVQKGVAQIGNAALIT
jgi:hypothetical protein